MNADPKLDRIYEAKDYQDGTQYTTQVCIIGSGCGGATLAKRLTDFGIDVIVLEQGGYYPATKMDQRELNMAGKLYAEHGLSVASDNSTVLMSGNNIGGASVHYWADSYRTPEDKLQSWEDTYGMKGHTLADLSPAFDAIEKSLNVHPASDQNFNTVNQKLHAASQSLNWHGHRVPQARKHCVGSGHCMQGCLYDAKQSQMITHIPTAKNHHTKAVRLHSLATLLDVLGAGLFCDRDAHQSSLPIAQPHPITKVLLILFFCIDL